MTVKKDYPRALEIDMNKYSKYNFWVTTVQGLCDEDNIGLPIIAAESVVHDCFDNEKSINFFIDDVKSWVAKSTDVQPQDIWTLLVHKNSPDGPAIISTHVLFVPENYMDKVKYRGLIHDFYSTDWLNIVFPPALPAVTPTPNATPTATVTPTVRRKRSAKAPTGLPKNAPDIVPVVRVKRRAQRIAIAQNKVPA